MNRRLFLLVLILVLIALPVITVMAQDDDGEGCPEGPVAEDAPVVTFGAAVSDTGKYAREGGEHLA